MKKSKWAGLSNFLHSDSLIKNINGDLLKHLTVYSEVLPGVWEWRLQRDFIIHTMIGRDKENKFAYIDAKFLQLKDKLIEIEGIVVQNKVILHHKFIGFSDTIMPSGRIEKAGYRFAFESTHALDRFFRVCDVFSDNGIEAATSLADTLPRKKVKSTTKVINSTARMGQANYRKGLFSYWKGCSVTGCMLPYALKASHIKPWSKSNEKERLDLYNGLLLIPNLDSLFDSGLITFGNNGMIRISPKLNEQQSKILGVSDCLKLKKIALEHLPYLEYHREHVFISG